MDRPALGVVLDPPHPPRLRVRPLPGRGATLFGYKPDAVGWLLAAVASLLPDIDLPTSKIGRLLFWLSVPLERRFGHRTITHSLVVLSAVAALAAPLAAIRPQYWGCAVGGY